MELKKKSEQLNELITHIIKGEVSIPNNSLVFLDSKTLIEVFTKRRAELLDYIKKYHPQSVQKLASLVHRKKQAVNRDLRILQSHELVKMEKKGRIATPTVEKVFIVYEIGKIPAKT
jgi:predicted transcriptional regulator